MLTKLLGVVVEFHHVKGHQDLSNFGPFTHDATLNIEADVLTQTKLTGYMPGLAIFHIPWSQGVCYIDLNA